MHQIPGYSLWRGHVGDSHGMRRLFDLGIEAIVDLALNEPPVTVPRELIYCRIPLIDGAGNPEPVLRLAVQTVASLIASGTPTLVACGNGMSRAPAIVAAALARHTNVHPDQALELVARGGACDVSPGLWQEVAAVRS